ncbi:hypothetical protein PLESTM_001575800 [Pleodorina starrii]|nr:hypothetical protein PLESTM_001575800 [Pleodorina starrii]
MADAGKVVNTGAYGVVDEATTPTVRDQQQHMKKGTTLLEAVLPTRNAAGLPVLPPRTSGSKSKPSDWVRDQFDKENGICNHCGKKTRLTNVTHNKQHLLNTRVCSFSRSEEARKLAPSVPEVALILPCTNMRSPLQTSMISNALSANVDKATPPSQKRQAISFVDRMTTGEQETLEKAFALMLIVTNMPFHWAEQPIVSQSAGLNRLMELASLR